MDCTLTGSSVHGIFQARILEWVAILFPDSSAGKESACNTGDPGSIPGLARSPGEGKEYPRQYSGLENPMDCIVHRVAESQTRLSDFHSLTLQEIFLIQSLNLGLLHCRLIFDRLRHQAKV